MAADGEGRGEDGGQLMDRCWRAAAAEVLVPRTGGGRRGRGGGARGTTALLVLLLLLNEMASTLRGECVIDLAEAYSLSGFA